ncbi:phosphoglucosamine mutase, partial [Escherichia coli]|nr:phosphoglucosamine mutase [Escherichia coli]
IMSNLGLERSLKNLGIRLLRTPVGDKYVLEELLRTNSELGGEQSGHIIFPAISLVGDGIVTAASVLKTASKRSEKFSSLAPDFK